MRILLYFVLLIASSLATFAAAPAVGVKIDDLNATNASPESAIMIINQPIGARLTNDTFKTVVSNLFTSRTIRQATVQISGATPFYYAGFDADGYLTSLAPPSSPTSGITGTLTAPFVTYATSAGTIGSTAFSWDGSSNMTGPNITLTNSLTVYGAGTNSANNLILTNWLVQLGPIYWQVGASNILYNSNGLLISTNNTTDGAGGFQVIDGAGNYARIGQNAAGQTFFLASGAVNQGFNVTANNVVPIADGSMSLGSSSVSSRWADAAFSGSIYLYGFLSGTNSSYARIRHDNSYIYFDSEAFGTGNYKPFAFARGSTNFFTITPNPSANSLTLANPANGQITIDQAGGSTTFQNTSASLIISSAVALLDPAVGTTDPVQFGHGFKAANTTPATGSTRQFSPAFIWETQGYGTNSATSQLISFGAYIYPTNGLNTPTAALTFVAGISNAAPTTLLKLASDAAFPNSSTFYLDGTGHWSTPGGGGGGGQTPWISDINAATFSLTNALRVEASSLKTAAPSGASASTFTLGVYSGGGSNVARLVMGATTYDLSTNSAASGAISGGFNEYSTFSTLNPIPDTTYTDLEFPTGGVVETDALAAGTYIVTAKVGFGMYRSGGAALWVRLYNNDPAVPGPDQPLAGSNALIGSENSPAGVYANYSATVQGQATIVTAGSKVIVQVYDTIPGDTDSYMQPDQSSISWLKLQ